MATITDYSTYTNDGTTMGGSSISTSEKKFGTGSLSLSGSGQYVQVSDSPDWIFGADDLTWECWFNSTANGVYQIIFGQYADATNWGGMFVYPDASGGQVGFGYLNAGSWDINASVTGLAMPPNTWHHIAIVRASNTWYTYLNGTRYAMTLNLGSWSSTFPNFSGDVYIGTLFGNFGLDFAGYIDELRISKGIARWTDPTFTLPTTEY